MRLARVVAVHGSRRTVDLVFMDTGLRVPEASVMSSMVSSDAGVWNVPSVPPPTSEQSAGSLPKQGRQLIACVDFSSGLPVVMGFLHPLGGQIAFDQPDRQVDRHASGAYTTIAPDGSIETYHPSGSYIRVGAGAHESLSGLNGAWQEASGAPAPTVTVHCPKFDLTIDPAGNVTVHGQGNANMTFDQSLTVSSGADMAFHAGGGLSFTAGAATTMNSTGGFAVVAATIDLN